MAIMRTPQRPMSPKDDDSFIPRGGQGLPGDAAEGPQAPPMADLGGTGPGGETPSRGGETPRERPAPGGGVGGGMATPPQPMEPTPHAGRPPMQVHPPMAGPPPMALTSALRGSGGMFGSQGGLQGGGLGLPFDPTSDNESDPISGLLKQLLGGGGGAY